MHKRGPLRHHQSPLDDLFPLPLIERPATKMPKVSSETVTVPANGKRRVHSAAVAFGLVLVCGLTPAALALAPRPGEPVVVLTVLPDAPLPRAVAASDVPILWLSAGGHVAVLDGTKPGLITELRRSGAVVLAAGPLGTCLPAMRRPVSLTGLPQP